MQLVVRPSLHRFAAHVIGMSSVAGSSMSLAVALLAMLVSDSGGSGGVGAGGEACFFSFAACTGTCTCKQQGMLLHTCSMHCCMDAGAMHPTGPTRWFKSSKVQQEVHASSCMHLRVRLAGVVQVRPGCCFHAARLTGGVTGLLAWTLLTRSARCSSTEGAPGTVSLFPGACAGWTALLPTQPMMACQRGFAVLPHCHLFATRPFDGKGLLQGQEGS